MHQLCAFSETQPLPLQIENRFYLEAGVAVRAVMISGMQPVHLGHGACELSVALQEPLRKVSSGLVTSW